MRKTISIGLALVASMSHGTDAWALGVPYTLQSSFSGTSATFFGYSVAIDRQTAVIGAIDDNGGRGAAFVYALGASGWVRQQTLTAPSSAMGDELGYSVAVNGDTALAGSVATSDVQVFLRAGTAWTRGAPIHDPDVSPQAGDCFGCATALTGDTAVVGAPGKAGGAGRAYVFVRQSGVWQWAQTLSGQTGDSFGFAVALSPDAATALVGAFGASSETGAAYFFARNGSTWSAPQIVTAPDGAAHDRFGCSTSLQNETALIGSYGHGGQGAAYLFAKTAGAWSWLAPQLVASDAAANDGFGISVALTTNSALVGAHQKAGARGPGAVYVFSNVAGAWSLPSQQELLPSAAGQYFGYAVAASQGRAVVGGFGAADSAGSSDAGTISIFTSAAAVSALGPVGHGLALGCTLAMFGFLALRRRAGDECR